MNENRKHERRKGDRRRGDRRQRGGLTQRLMAWVRGGEQQPATVEERAAAAAGARAIAVEQARRILTANANKPDARLLAFCIRHGIEIEEL